MYGDPITGAASPWTGAWNTQAATSWNIPAKSLSWNIPAEPSGQVLVHDGSIGARVIATDVAPGAGIAGESALQVRRALDFLRTSSPWVARQFPQHSPVHVVLNDPSAFANARWGDAERAVLFGPVTQGQVDAALAARLASGKALTESESAFLELARSFPRTPEVVTHELSHHLAAVALGPYPALPRGAAATAAGRIRAIEGQAVHEAIGDMVAASYLRTWDLLGRNPATAAAKVGTMVTTMDEFAIAFATQGSKLNPHMASGVITHTAANIQAAIGWDRFTELVFDSLPRLQVAARSTANPATFEHVAVAMRASAKALFSRDPSAIEAITKALSRARL